MLASLVCNQERHAMPAEDKHLLTISTCTPQDEGMPREIRAEIGSHAVSAKYGLKTYKAPATPTMMAIEGL